jgi:putative addiction module component (TIGR02574 family)
MNKALRDQVMNLPANERAELAHELWDSVEPDELFPLTDAQRLELQRRIEEHRRDPSTAIPWEVVKKDLLDRFK